MNEPLDPYFHWLDIPATEQPPHHYRLLGISLFESDPQVINSAADQRLARLRELQLGDHAETAARLMNDVSAAKLCLLGADSKAAYDAALREGMQASPMAPMSPPPPVAPSPTAADQQFPPLVARRAAVASADSPASRPARRSRLSNNTILLWSISFFTLVAGLVILAQRFSRRAEPLFPADAVELSTDNKDGKQELVGQRVIVPPNFVLQQENGDLPLPIARAEVRGEPLTADGVLEWEREPDRVRWQFLISKPGFFSVEVTYAADQHAAGNTAQISVADRKFEFHVRDTGGWESYATDSVKTVLIRRGGQYELVIRPGEVQSTTLMRLKSVYLRRVPAGGT
ncbi:MAG: hypothetical protein OES79_02260 [Planctomycetota bacterium]|nr:hypothetical protein [Planctomycetota bacterium]